MNKRIYFVKASVAVLTAVFLSVCFTGCIFSQEKVKTCTAIPGNGCATITWTTSMSVSSSTIYVDVSPAPSSRFPVKMETGATVYFIDGLTNGVTYTFTVENFDDEGSVYSAASDRATPSEDSEQLYTYSASSPSVTLDASKNVITLSNVKNKTIVFANVNTSGQPVYSNNVRVVLAANGRSAAGALTALAAPTENEAFANERALAAELKQETAGKIRHYTPPEIGTVNPHFVPATSTSARYNFDDEDDDTTDDDSDVIDYAGDFDIDNPQVGQYRYVYVDGNPELSTYTRKKVYLRAIGTYTGSGSNNGNDVCLLWVDDDCFTTASSCSGKYINSSVAKNLANTFAAHYYHERSVFGEESDKFYMYDSSTNGMKLTTMTDSNSDTGTYVNIVVYDIGADFDLSSDSQCGVVGYFYSKDYFETADSVDARENDDTTTFTWADVSGMGGSTICDTSNGGKYFYIDSGFCNLSGATTSGYVYKGNSGKASDTVISTLVHEFQHMINFNQKNLLHGVASDAWYNEMLSMLAEDMMQGQLGTTDTEAPRGSRLPGFNKYYYYSGLEYRDNTSYTVISYSTIYAFGAWLARTYGGPELVSKMSKSSSVDFDSVVAAIKAQTGTTITMADLQKQYTQACVFRTQFAYDNNLPTFHVDAGNPITTDGYTSKMTAIDLFSEDYGYGSDTTTDTNTYLGPALASSSQQVDVRPHGFLLHAIGTASQDTVTIVFANQEDVDDEVIIYVQDKFNNVKE